MIPNKIKIAQAIAKELIGLTDELENSKISMDYFDRENKWLWENAKTLGITELVDIEIQGHFNNLMNKVISSKNI